MNNLQIINQQIVLGKKFKVYGDFENPLFLAKDVAEWIDYGFDSKGNRDTNGMLRTIDEEEKSKNINPINNRVSWFLTEDGLYEVLMQSRKPMAKRFKKEVKKILKHLRKGELQINALDNAILKIFHEEDGLKRLEAAKTIEKISHKNGFDEGFHKGFEEGERVTYSKAEQEVLSKIINGTNRNRNLTQIAQELTDAWFNELEGRIISTSDISRWMEHRGFIVKIRFEKTHKGNVIFDKDGSVVYEKRVHSQPTEKFEKWISGKGYVTTGVTNDGRKKTINYQSDFVERMIQIESNKNDFIEFIRNYDKKLKF